MKRFNTPGKQRGFADLRQQIAEMVGGTPPADEVGQLPGGDKSMPEKRATLHLPEATPKPSTPRAD